MEWTTVETNVITGETTTRVWTQEEIDARKARLAPYTWESIRSRRNKLLQESDIKMLPDLWATLTEEKKNEWLAYRQALRDLPATITDPFEPFDWPVKPT